MLQKGYNKLCSWVSIKKITVVSLLLFAVALLPLLYLGFFNRASGDDYGYGALTHAAWLSSHSLTEVAGAACQTVRQLYTSWQGTWFSVFVFALQPEVFSSKAYVLVTFLMLFLWLGSTYFVFHYLLRKIMHFSVWYYLLITTVLLLPVLEFLPGQKSAFFWFNGGVHYILPFSMCQMLFYHLLKYADEGRKKHFISIIVILTLLGGSNYQAALFGLLLTFYTLVWRIWVKDRRGWLLCIPLIMELAGLYISVKAPGNAVRAGEELSRSPVYIIQTIGKSFLYGARDIYQYLTEFPLVFVGLLLVLAVSIEAFSAWKESEGYKIHPMIPLAGWSIYFAMQAPAIYASVEVSRGVLNTNQQVFMLAAFLTLLYVAQKLSFCKTGKVMGSRKVHQIITIPVLILTALSILLFRSDLKQSVTWDCFEYIRSGQAADYREQMNLQTELLENTQESNVTVPFINDEQGPLMQMPVTEDANAWSNTVTAQFYGKKSVVAIPRTLWEEKYGQ